MQGKSWPDVCFITGPGVGSVAGEEGVRRDEDRLWSVPGQPRERGPSEPGENHRGSI